MYRRCHCYSSQRILPWVTLTIGIEVQVGLRKSNVCLCGIIQSVRIFIRPRGLLPFDRGHYCDLANVVIHGQAIIVFQPEAKSGCRRIRISGNLIVSTELQSQVRSGRSGLGACPCDGAGAIIADGAFRLNLSVGGIKHHFRAGRDRVVVKSDTRAVMEVVTPSTCQELAGLNTDKERLRLRCVAIPVVMVMIPDSVDSVLSESTVAMTRTEPFSEPPVTNARATPSASVVSKVFVSVASDAPAVVLNLNRIFCPLIGFWFYPSA